MYDVLKPFPLSYDGLRVRNVVCGERVAVPADLVPGLRAAGFIAPAAETGENGTGEASTGEVGTDGVETGEAGTGEAGTDGVDAGQPPVVAASAEAPRRRRRS